MSARAITFEEAKIIVDGVIDAIYVEKRDFIEAYNSTPQYVHVPFLVKEAFDLYYSIVEDNDSLFNLDGTYYTLSLEVVWSSGKNMFHVTCS